MIDGPRLVTTRTWTARERRATPLGLVAPTRRDGQVGAAVVESSHGLRQTTATLLPDQLALWLMPPVHVEEGPTRREPKRRRLIERTREELQGRERIDSHF
jgi:hypothetical protein